MKAHVALCLFLVGCVADPLSTSDDVEVLDKMQAGTTCDEWECGTNSGQIPLAGNIWDFPRIIGAENSTGYTLTFFGKRPSQNSYVAYLPKVENGILKAYRNGVWYVAESDVVGLMWRLEKVVGGQLKRFEVVVAGVDNHPFTARYNNAGVATHSPRAVTYTFKWREYLTVWPQSPTGTSGPHPPPLFELCGVNVGGDGMADFSAVIFEGDKIDPETISVTGDSNANDTFGCAGHALAKQHLGGYTIASATVLKWAVPSLARRTAHLKAMTGDYLGIGISFTYAGVAMLRRDNLTMPSTMGGGYRLDTTGKQLSFLFTKKLEARWNQYGAICLNIPRVDFRVNADDAANFPGGVENLFSTFVSEDHPRPPPCTGTYTDATSAYITTVNYGMLPIIPL